MFNQGRCAVGIRSDVLGRGRGVSFIFTAAAVVICWQSELPLPFFSSGCQRLGNVQVFFYGWNRYDNMYTSVMRKSTADEGGKKRRANDS